MEKSLQNFLEPSQNPQVIYTDNSLECGELCEELSWNHGTSTPHRSETNGISERAVRRVKGRNFSRTATVWFGWKNGVLMLWNAIAICETSEASWRMGKLPTTDELEKHSRD